MKRFLLLLTLLLFGTAFPLFGQTIVNLTVTDSPDNQLWKNGTWSVQLQPGAGNLSQTNSFTLLSGGGSLAAQSGSLSATATAAISLPANANIGPGGTIWQFTVCPQASAGCFQQSVTVSTSTPQTLAINPPSIRINLSTATPPISAYATGEITGAVIGSQFYLLGTGIQVCTVISGNSCTTWTTSGGGIAAVSSLPATCTPGTTAPVQLSTGTYPSLYVCGPVANQWTGFGNFHSGYQGLAPQDFGAKGDGRTTMDGVLTAASAVVTSATMAFCNGGSVACGTGKTSDVGKVFEATNGAISISRTVASVQSATQITLSSTQSSFNAGSTQISLFTDDTAALLAWVAAGMTQGTVHSFYLPRGLYYTSKPLVFDNTLNAANECGGWVVPSSSFIRCGLQLVGVGATASMIHPATATTGGNGFNWSVGAPSANNSGVVYINGFAFGNLWGWAIEGDQVPYTSTGLTTGGNAAGIYIASGNSHIFGQELWVNRIDVTDANVNNTQGWLDNGCFECSFYNTAVEGNGAGSNARIVLAEKELYDTFYFESGGVSVNNLVIAGTITQDRFHNIHLQHAGSDTNGSQLFFAAGTTVAAGQSFLLEGIRMDGGSTTDVGVWLSACTGGLVDFEGSNLYNAQNSATARLIRIDSGVTCPITFNGGLLNAGGGTGVAVLNNAAGANVYITNTPVTGAISGTNSAGVFQLAQTSTGWGGNGGITGTYFISNQGTACAIGNFALSAGWGTTAAPTAPAGFNQSCRITITASGTGQAANPTITWTLPNALPAATTACEAHQSGGTGAFTMILQTALSATAPIFTLQGTPTAAATYIYDIRCGP